MKVLVRALFAAVVMVVALAFTNVGRADAGPYWAGCLPHVDPETLEIYTLCY